MDRLKKIEQIIESRVRPVLRTDHGDVEIVKLDQNVLIVRVLGKCASCPNAQTEIQKLIECALQVEQADEIRVEIEITVNSELVEIAKKILRKEIMLSSSEIAG